MKWLLFCLYRMGILFYFGGIRLAAALGHRQARARRRGLRQGPFFFKDRQPGQPLVWFHCASAGELEQAIPVMEILKKHRPDVYVLVSVFSPSGWEYAIRRQYTCVDALTYLPDDVPGAARRWLKLWQASVAIFVKYEFWWGFLRVLQKNHLPTFLIAAYFTAKHRRLAGFYKHVLPAFTRIFVQNDSAQAFCDSLGIQSQVAGDTRLDRVVTLKQLKEKEVAPYRNDVPTVVLGSLWSQDLKVLKPVILKHLTEWRWILCPHKPETMTSEFQQMVKEGQPRVCTNVEALLRSANPGIYILKQMGVLSWLYGTGRWAYVGGGFGRGIHNTLEAAVWGIPVLCGPRIQRFAEALELRDRGVLHVIRNSEEAFCFLKNLTPTLYNTINSRAQRFFSENKGASERIGYDLKFFLPEPK